MQNDSWFDNSDRWGPGAHAGPPLFEDRVDELYVPMAARLGRPPTLIVFQSSLWDLRWVWVRALETSISRNLVEDAQDNEVHTGLDHSPLSPLHPEHVECV